MLRSAALLFVLATSPVAAQMAGAPEAAGDRVALRFTGLQELTASEIESALGDRLIYVRRFPASEATASDAAFLVESLLRRQGFSQAGANARPSADARSILLTVSEGPRVRVGEVVFSGNSPENDRTLRRLLNAGLLPGVRRPLRISIPFNEERIESGLENIRIFHQGLGYWQAEVSARQIPNPPDAVDLEIHIECGPMFALRETRFEETNPALVEALAPVAAGFAGREAGTATIEELRAAMIETARGKGSPRVSVTLDPRREGTHLDLVASVRAAAPMTVGAVKVEGLERTNEQSVTRWLTHHQGTQYDPDRVRADVRDLLRTGAFTSFLLNERYDTATDKLDLIFLAEEESASRVGVYAGWDSEAGPLGGLLYENFNALDRLHMFTVRGEYSALGPLGDAMYSVPRILNTRWAAGITGRLSYRDYDGFTPITASTGLPFVRTWENGHSLSISPDLARTEVRGLDISDNLAGPALYTLAGLTLTHQIDRRDSRTLPQSGWRIRHQHGIFAATTDDPPIFSRHTANSSIHFPIRTRHHLSLGLDAGAIFCDDELSVPLNERFFLGGSTTHRGFAAREFGPRTPDNRYAVGGLAYQMAHVEWSSRIAGPLALAAFCDAGEVFPSPDDWDISEWRPGAGIGLRVNLPTGPLRCDYGFNLDRRPNEDPAAFHFSLGIAF